MINKNYSIRALSFVMLWCSNGYIARSQDYHVNRNAHSHNDYLQSQPFYQAHANNFFSMEVDLFLKDGELYVAHTSSEITPQRTFDALYLEPILREIGLHEGKPYAKGGKLQLLLDLKKDGPAIMQILQAKLQPHRRYFDLKNNPDAIKLVISGNAPKPGKFGDYDDIFWFDGSRAEKYTAEQSGRVAFVSAPFQSFSVWNGLGRMVESEQQAVKRFVDSVHTAGKTVRLWGAPDTRTTWIAFMKLGVDLLNTDSPNELARFLNASKDNTYLPRPAHPLYTPSYKTDRAGKKPKNVILLISDGAGFSQLWAAATANHGSLHATLFQHLGFSRTEPADDYNTDSAAGATAMSTGKKTNNRHIGSDSLGAPVPNLIDRLADMQIKSGIISNDGIAGATPSSFYAHQRERNDQDKISADLVNSKATLVIAGSNKFVAEGTELNQRLKAKGFSIEQGINQPFAGSRIIRFDQDRPDEGFRLIESAFDKSVKYLENEANGKGFFLVIEGAKIDGGGHGNQIAQCIDEYLSFDKVVGQALKFADTDGETLVIVTSDHETGGLILYDGNYQTGAVTGTFTTTDHTGLPVPLLSYGPGAEKFTGFIGNNEIPLKILELLGGKGK